MDIIIAVCVVVCGICIACGKPIRIIIKHEYPQQTPVPVPEKMPDELNESVAGMAEAINAFLDGTLKDGDLNG